MSLHAFERAIMGELPLGEAAAYFIKLKTAAKEVPPPDTTGALEGQFSVPVERALSVMADLVRNEFESIYAYNVYAQSLRDLSHDSIADHFDEHSDDELDHANFLLKRMSVLGGPVHVPDLQAPKPSSDPTEIIQTMVRMEQEGIAGWRNLLSIVGDNPMKVTVEDYMAKEQEHLDDLWQLLPHQEHMPVLQQKMAARLDEDPALAGTAADEVYRSRVTGCGNSLPDLINALKKRREYEDPSNPDFKYPSVDKLSAVVPPASVLQAMKGAGGAVSRHVPVVHAPSMLSPVPKYRPVRPEQMVARHTPIVPTTPETLRNVPKYRPLTPEQMVPRYEQILPTTPDTLRNVPKYQPLRHEPLLPTATETLGKVGGVLPLLRKLAEEPAGINAWLAQEQMAQQAQEANEGAYFRMQAQAAQAAAQQKEQEAQALQQQIQAVQQQVQQMQSELDNSGQLQRQVLEQARAVEQQAAQSAVAAHQAASAATLQSMQSAQEVLRHKMLTANMQQNVQGWKQQLMGIAQADPTTAAGSQVALPLSGPTPQQVGAVPTADGPMTPGAAEHAASPPGPINSPPPIGNEAQGGQSTGDQPTPEQSLIPATKQASIDALFRKIAKMQKEAVEWKGPAIGAAIGATTAGSTGYLMGKSDLDAANARVAELESKKVRGEGGFATSLALVAQRLRRDLVEMAKEHPVASVAAPAAWGAVSGAMSGRGTKLLDDLGAISKEIKYVRGAK